MQPPVQQQQVPRDWNGFFLCCFGDCDGVGWGSCCLSYFCPCVSFGWNRKRAFASNAFLWGGIFLLIGAVGGIIAGATEKNRNCTTEYTSNSVRHTCTSELSTAGAVALVIAGLLIFALGFWNRIQIRERFGLPGNALTDGLLWFFCSTCALCQETRTLWANNVDNGVWQGPMGMMVNPGGVAMVAAGQPVQQPYSQGYQEPYSQGYQQQTPYQQSPYQKPPVQEYDTKM
ncbi:hypothetical protein BSKO_03082 [Bryopsis sp. KO-2023]|nr:hypothetical protein BSKO_03082 [Bryopsis sp. KO-2023]